MITVISLSHCCGGIVFNSATLILFGGYLSTNGLFKSCQSNQSYVQTLAGPLQNLNFFLVIQRWTSVAFAFGIIVLLHNPSEPERQHFVS